MRTAGPIPALCCCYPRCLASCCALHHFCGLKASLVFFVLLFSAQAGGREADRTLGTSRGANKCRVWHSPGNGDSAEGWYWEPAGCPGIPQTMLEEPDLETGLEEPNSRRFCAGLSPNGYWIVFSWVSFMSLPPVLGSHPHLERAHPHFGRGPLFGDSVHCPPPAGSLEAPVSRGGFSVPCFWGTLGLFGAGARSCAELPHVLSLSPAPMSPRVAGITLQLPDLPADVCMCVSPSSLHAPSPSLPVPLPGVPDWDPTWGRGCL